MDRKVKWRIFWLAVLVGLAVLTLMPTFVGTKGLPSWYPSAFSKKVQLGLDLEGGLHITYGIDLRKAVEDEATRIKRDIEAQLEEGSIAGKVTTPSTPTGAVTVTLDDPAKLEGIGNSIRTDFDETISMLDCPAGSDLTRTICFRVSSDYAEGIKESALEQAIRTVEERINEKGIAEPSVVAKGDQIIVELPGLDEDEIKRVKNLIERTAKLEFKIVDEANPSDPNDYMIRLYNHVKDDELAKSSEYEIETDIDQWQHEESGKGFADYFLTAKDKEGVFMTRERAEELGLEFCKEEDQGVRCTMPGNVLLRDYLDKVFAAHPELEHDDEHQIAFEKVTPSAKDATPFWRSYYLYKAVELGGTAVSKAQVDWDQTTNKPNVIIDFTRWGGRRFGELTGKNVGRKMAVVLDEKVTSAPVIQTRIDGGKSSISMGESNPERAQKAAQDLVAVLRTGSLPAPLQVDAESKVGPMLGPDAVGKAQFAFALGSLLVVLIMIFYYRVGGVLAIVALALNIFFTVAILAAFGATLTLPGIAALVLTVGMAVDANIIIYERIREELRSGKSVTGSVDAGFSHGFSAILDGQLTTAAAGFVLYQYGSGPIKGFAVMLIIGIMCTLFTATWCTRLFFELYVGKGRKATTIAI